MEGPWLRTCHRILPSGCPLSCPGFGPILPVSMSLKLPELQG